MRIGMTIKVNFEETTQDGKVYEKDAVFPVADENGNYISEVPGNLFESFKLSKRCFNDNKKRQCLTLPFLVVFDKLFYQYFVYFNLTVFGSNSC